MHIRTATPRLRGAGRRLRRWGTPFLIGLVPALAAFAPICARAEAAPPTMPIEEIRPGMKGVGRTVFTGTKIEEFGVEILGVMHNSRPKGDLILFRGEGPVLEHTGVIAGMSGSPVYVDGKLIGAIAFAYPMAKDPIGAITPIGEMLDIFALPHSQAGSEDGEGDGAPGPESGAAKGAAGGAASGVAADAGSAATSAADDADGSGGRRAFDAAWTQFLRRGAPAPAGSEQDAGRSLAASAGAGAAGGLEPLALPISMSGWAPALQPEISRGLRDLGFGVTGVSGGTVPAGQPVPRLEPGAAVGLQLVSGDANLAAIGTVTMVDGDRVLAFGHPMIQAGPVAVPMTGAVIQTVLPNLEVSFKMGSATAPVGGIFEDRRTGVAGKMGPVPPMIPVTVTVEGPGSAPNVFHYQVVRQPALTPMFLPWAVTNAYLAAGWAEGDAWARSDVTVWYDGGQSLHRTERFSTDSPGTSLGNEITLPATLLLTNPFERARLDSINVRLGFDRRKSEARVLRMSAPQTKLHVGDTLAVRVTIDPYRGAQEDRVVRFPIPAGWAGQRIVVSAGGIAEMIDWDKDRAPGKYAPENMGQLRMLIEQVPDEATLIVRAVSRTSGSLVGVRELPGLPPSLAAASEAAGNQSSVRDTAGSLLAEQRIDTPWLVSGRETIQVEVAE